ncbi:MAG: response regulator transcription factor, partial [Actinomycetota bacterium]
RWDAVPADPASTPIRVIVVDDDPMLRSSVVELLEDLGFSVVAAAEDGERGVSLAAEHRPDVVLMDLRMPGIDGIEATRRIRGADDTVQVVIYSAYSDAGFQAGAEEAGASRYLVKGCGPDLLADVLRAAGSVRRQLDTGAAADVDPPTQEGSR